MKTIQLILLILASFHVFAETKYVTAKSLNIRSGAGSENAIVGKLTQNQQVEVISEKEGWSQLENGWVASRFLSIGKVQPKADDKLMLICDIEKIPYGGINHPRINEQMIFEISPTYIKVVNEGDDWVICESSKCKIKFNSEFISWEENLEGEDEPVRYSEGMIDRRTGNFKNIFTIYKGTLSTGEYLNQYWDERGPCRNRNEIKRKF